MPTTDAQVQAIEKELIVYGDTLPELMEMDNEFLKMLETTKSDPASNRATRIPLLQSTGGTFQQADMDGGDLGASSGPVTITATLVPVYFTSGYSITALAEYATTGAERGVKSASELLFDVASDRFAASLDMILNTAGNGVLGTVTSYSNPVITLTTDGFKEELFYIGMPVQVFNSTLVTDRGSSTITNINRAAHTITLAADISGTTGGDFVVIDGISVPATIQSSIFGIPYHQSNATTGLWLGLNRATYSNIVTPAINASSSGLTTAFIRAALNQIRMNVGDKQYRGSNLKPYMHPAQADAWEALAIVISQIFKDPSGNQGVDLMFGNENNMSMAGRPIIQSIHANRTRIDFLCLKNWGKIVGTDSGYYKVGEQFVFPEYGASGNSLKSAKFFYLKYGLQTYNKNPLAGSYVYGLAIPAGAGY